MYKYDPKKYFLFLKCVGAIILRMIGATKENLHNHFHNKFMCFLDGWDKNWLRKNKYFLLEDIYESKIIYILRFKMTSFDLALKKNIIFL